jgi:hypothetical protein
MILLKLTRMEQQQLHLTQLVQRVCEMLQTRDESFDIPAELSLPLKNSGELNELERKLEDSDYLRNLVMLKVVLYSAWLLFHCVSVL